MTTKRGTNDFLELVKSRGPKPPQPPHLLSLIHQHMVAHCESALNSLFHACDDAFYDLSQRATNSDENLYFESMRKVRIAKQGIIRQFNQNLADRFRRFADGHDSSAEQPAQDHKLAIVDGDQLEVDLALKNMTSRTRDMYREPLYHLHVRLNHLLLRADDHKTSTPLDPEQVAQTFIEACSNVVDLDIKVRLILFKLYEEHVLKRLAPVYTHANQLLSDAGVLPKVPRQLNKDDSDESARAEPNRTPEAEPFETALEPSAAADAVPTAQRYQQRFNMNLATLVSLVAATRHSPTAGAQAAGPVINCFIVTSGNPGPNMSATQLSGLLSRAQLVVDRQLAQGPKNVVPDLVDKLLRKADAKAPQSLAETDEAIINLVSLFFDQILTDDNLPLAVYALVCRLQIPILKIALQDSEFFARHDHPAREFINTITEAGISFDENKPLERDPVYRKMSDLVHTVTREPKVSEALFEQAYQELRATIRAEQRRFSLVERRTSQSAAGRSRIRCAKRQSQGLLYELLNEAKLPPPVTEFLTTAWMQVLLITQLKHGHGSTEWDANAEIAEDLVWLCQRHQDVCSLQRRERLQPVLLDRIEAGLAAAIENPQVRAEQIQNLHQVLEQLNFYPHAVEYCDLTQQQLEALGHVGSTDAGRSNEAQASPATLDKAPDGNVADTYLDKVRNLSEGAWVEYRDEHSDRRVRYKLAAKVDSDIYVFVNRMGFRALERSCQELAADLQSGRIKLLPASEFFDRMMNKVLSRISHAA